MGDLDKELMAECEDLFELPRGFCDSLLQENDYVFVVQTHALLEVVLTRLIVLVLLHPAIEEAKADIEHIIHRLEMSNPQTGKLAFAKALGILDDEERRFLRNFSELRNALVHYVNNVTYDIHTFVNTLDERQFSDWIRKFSSGTDTDLKEAMSPLVRARIRQRPKEYLWDGAMGVLAWVVLFITRGIEHNRFIEKHQAFHDVLAEVSKQAAQDEQGRNGTH
ncbi:MAG: hypothetical protein V1873_09020 [Verrucomicrobiota bacterium]